MKTINWHGIVAACAVAVWFNAGCATPYQRVGRTGGISETQLAPDIFRITSYGNGYSVRERVSDFALLRAAELAIENGFTHFLVMDETSGGRSQTRVTPTTTTTRLPPTAQLGKQTVPLGVATTTTSGGDVKTVFRPETSITVRMMKNPGPDLVAYDATFLSKSIRQKYGLK